MNTHSSPRQRALAALASLAAAAPVPAVEMAVGNRLVIIGALEVALGWAERLAATMQVTVVATAPGWRSQPTRQLTLRLRFWQQAAFQ